MPDDATSDGWETLEWLVAAWTPVFDWATADPAGDTLPELAARVQAAFCSIADAATAEAVLRASRRARFQALGYLLGHIQALDPALPPTDVILRQAFCETAAALAARGLEQAGVPLQRGQLARFMAGLAGGATEPVSPLSVAGLAGWQARATLHRLDALCAPGGIPASVRRLLLAETDAVPLWSRVLHIYLAAELDAEPGLAMQVLRHLPALEPSPVAATPLIAIFKMARRLARGLERELADLGQALPVATPWHGMSRQQVGHVELARRIAGYVAVAGDAFDGRLRGHGDLAGSPEAVVGDLLEAAERHGRLLATLPARLRAAGIGADAGRNLDALLRHGAYGRALDRLGSLASAGSGGVAALAAACELAGTLASLAGNATLAARHLAEAVRHQAGGRPEARVATVVELLRELRQQGRARLDQATLHTALAAVDAHLAQAGEALPGPSKAVLLVEKGRIATALAGVANDSDHAGLALSAFEGALLAMRAQPVEAIAVTALIGIAEAALTAAPEPARLRRAEQALEQALPILRRDQGPFRWMCAQRAAGDVKARLADGPGRAKALAAAAVCYEQALRVASREEWPEIWGELQLRRGKTLLLGHRADADPAALQAAVLALELSLQALPEPQPPTRSAADAVLWLAAAWEAASKDGEDAPAGAMAARLYVVAQELLIEGPLPVDWPSPRERTLLTASETVWRVAQRSDDAFARQHAVALARQAVAHSRTDDRADSQFAISCRQGLARQLVLLSRSTGEAAHLLEARQHLEAAIVIAEKARMGGIAKRLAVQLERWGTSSDEV